jgi:hypothetical protein
MPSTESFLIAMVMLLVCWSHRAITMEPHGLHERKGRPASHSVVTQDHANMPQAPSPLLVTQWSQVP